LDPFHQIGDLLLFRGILTHLDGRAFALRTDGENPVQLRHDPLVKLPVLDSDDRAKNAEADIGSPVGGCRPGGRRKLRGRQGSGCVGHDRTCDWRTLEIRVVNSSKETYSPAWRITPVTKGSTTWAGRGKISRCPMEKISRIWSTRSTTGSS